ncbi:MAG: DNA polymerase III subunit epsilon [Rhizobiales bacterium]|nr:DNA polymerase III subunit epsilon [Hyphomicrobiales bacterium]
MREIVFDTETTGFDPATGDRLVEIGCVELINQIPTGATYHVYINPEREMSEGAFAVHGLSTEFLSDKPRFADVADAFLEFVGDARLIAHNAEFDIRFIDFELTRLGRPAIGMGRAIDTLALARRKHPGAANSLDALCARYGVDNSRRVKHGALTDAEILAEVYAELTGGRQSALLLSAEAEVARGEAAVTARARPRPLASGVTPEEAAAHEAFLATMGEKALWRKYL